MWYIGKHVLESVLRRHQAGGREMIRSLFTVCRALSYDVENCDGNNAVRAVRYWALLHEVAVGQSRVPNTEAA